MTNLVLKCILQEDSKGKNTNRENERPSTTMIRRVLTTKFIEYLWIEREKIVMSDVIDNSSQENIGDNGKFLYNTGKQNLGSPGGSAGQGSTYGYEYYGTEFTPPSYGNILEDG
jgi:hypothetical protein